MPTPHPGDRTGARLPVDLNPLGTKRRPRTGDGVAAQDQASAIPTSVPEGPRFPMAHDAPPIISQPACSSTRGGPGGQKRLRIVAGPLLHRQVAQETAEGS